MVFALKPNLGPEIERRTLRSWRAAWEWLVKPLHSRPVHNLRVALESGDSDRLESLLDPAVAVVVHSNETEPPTIRVVRGIHDAVAWLQYGMAARPGLVILEREVNGQAGLVLNQAGEPSAAITVDFSGGLVSAVWIRMHPEKRRQWMNA